MLKCSGLCFQFCSNVAIYPLFWVGFNSHSGYNNSYTFVDKLSNDLSVHIHIILRSNPEHIPVCVIKTILKCGFRLVRTVLNGPSHGYILFEFLPIGGEKQNGVVVGFGARRAREGLACIVEVRVAVIQCFASPGTTINCS